MKDLGCCRLVTLKAVLFIIACLWGGFVWGQAERTVNGIVVDENGEPLPAAHVRQVSQSETGSVTSVITDLNGHFRILLPSVTKEIEVSFLGYETSRVKLTGDNNYRIQMRPTSELLEEVVVTGYQTISRERSTGSFVKVDNKKLEQVRLNSLNTLLEGRVSGYTDGLIRGTTSMNGMTTPLYVVDGFPIENTRYDSDGNLNENLPLLNMEDIESITVLKDAAAASIYGARAANGVIVITTKKAAKGKTNVSFSSTFTLTPYSYYKDNIADAATIIGLEREWAQNNPNLQGSGAAEYAASALSNSLYTSGGIRTILKGYAGLMSQSEVEDRLNNMASQGYRYFNDVEKYTKRNPFAQQYNLSVGKGTENYVFNASVTYRNNKLEDKYSGNESLGLNIMNSLQITKWLTLDLGSYLNYGTSTTQTYSALSPGYTYMPYDGLVNSDGSYYTSPAADRTSESYQHTLAQYGLYSMDITPLDEIGCNLSNGKDLSSRSYARLNIQFAPWLKYNAMFQYEYGSFRTDELMDKNSYTVRSKVNSFASLDNNGDVVFNLPYGNIYYTEDQYSNAYNFRQQLDFNKVFADKHDVTVIVGSETRHTKIEYTSNYLYNYDPDMLTYTAIDGNNLSTIQGILGGSSWTSRDMTYKREIINRFVSFYGNAGYTYDGRYTATASLRWDRSNLWGTNSKYQNKPLWSVGGSWNVQNEEFFKVPWINMLKVRFSYGIGGNIAKDSAPYMTANYYPNYNVGGIYGTISRRPNPELSWEKTITTNVGVDFALFNNRLNGSVDFYNKSGKDLLANTMGVPTEGFGYSTYSINNGEMINRGVDISLSGDVIATRDFSWNISLLYSHNKNEVTYVNVEAPVSYLLLDYPEAYPRIGNPYNAIYAYRWAGLSEDGLPQVYDENGEKVLSQPTSLDAIVYAGSTIPTYSGSVGSTLRYKNLEFSFLFIYEGGHKVRNTFLPYLNNIYSSITYGYLATIPSTLSANVADRWQKPGDELYTDVPRVVFSESPDYMYDSGSIYSYADINVLDASNIRLSNLSLAWRIPSSWCAKAFLKSARVQFNVENLFTIAKSKEAKYMIGGYENPNLVWGIYLNF